MKKLLTPLIVLLFACEVFGQPVVSSTSNPTTCNGTDGSITVSSVSFPNQAYIMNYTKNGVPGGGFIGNSNASSQLTFSNLGPGVYTNIFFTDGVTPVTLPGPIVLNNPTTNVQVAANPGNTVASGTSVTFMATTSNITSPSYQWYKNDVQVGTNSNTYTTSTYNNGDVISCVATGTCGTGTGSTTMNIIPVVSLSTSCNCASLLCTLTVASSIIPTNIIWKNNGVTVKNQDCSWNGTATTVAGGNGGGNGANQLNSPFGTHVDPAGNIYVMDLVNLRVQKWVPSAIAGTTVAGGNGLGTAANQFQQPFGIFVDAIGNVYVADGGNNRIQKWAPGATTGITVAGGNGFGLGLDKLNTPYDVFVDSVGNIYVAEKDADRVTKWAPGATSGVVVAGNNGTGSAANQLNGPTGVWVDRSGNVYVADNNNHRVQKWAPGTTSGITVAGGNGVGTAVNQLNFPIDVCADEAGNVYVADNLNNRVMRWIPGATSGTFAAGNGTAGSASFQFNVMSSVYIDANGYVYVSDRGNNRIQRFTPNLFAIYLPTTAGNYTAEPVTFNNATAATNSIQIITPAKPEVQVSANPGTTVTAGTPVTFTATQTGAIPPVYQWYHNYAPVGTNSNTYTTSSYNNGDIIACEVTLGCTFVDFKGIHGLKMNMVPSVSLGGSSCINTPITLTSSVPPSKIVWKLNGIAVDSTEATWAANATTVAGGNGNGTALNQLSAPVYVAVDANGKLFIAEQNNHRISSWIPPAVSGAVAAGVTGSLGVTQTTLNSPQAAAVNARGRLFVSDGFNNRVLSFPAGSTSGSPAESVIGQPNFVTAVSGSGLNQLSIASHIFVDGHDTVYVADRANNRVQKWAPGATTGVTVAGGNGSGSAANQLNGPFGLFVDNPGNIYASEPLNHRVQKWAPGATTGVTVGGGNLAGNAANQLQHPYGVFVDGNMTLYVSDYTNNRIQKWKAGATAGATIAGGNGIGSGANQVSPIGLTMDAAGNLYVADATNERIQKFALNTTMTYLPTTAGTYTAEVTAFNGTVSTTAPLAIGTPVTPSVSIVSDVPANTICAGTNVTFTATPTNGGATPAYQWKKNGFNVGSNSAIYADNSLNNGDMITCDLTNSEPCVSPSTVVSNTVTITVNPVLVPSVSIVSNAPANTICNGTSVTFTATPVNEGSSPIYQWKKNGTNVGTNSTTYIDAALVNGDAITCELTSNAQCAAPTTATSAAINMTVNPIPTVNPISNQALCNNAMTTAVNFTGSVGGATYNWTNNTTSIGLAANGASNIAAFTAANATTSAVTATIIVTPTASGCTGTSENFTITVNPTINTTVNIATNTGTTICQGVAVIFNAVSTNPGTSPAYQWKLNGTNVGSNTANFGSSSIPGGLVNGDIVSVTMTSNIACTNPVTANVTMTVNPPVPPTSVTISANPGNVICSGTSVAFTAAAAGAGASPIYQWQRNGVNVGTNSSVYTSSAHNHLDDITCIVKSSFTCPGSLTSNVITMNVTPTVTPIVTISTSTGTPVCQGVSVTFLATTTASGNNPVYVWKVDGNTVGTNTNAYTTSALTPGNHTVTCQVTSNANCISTNVVTGSYNILVHPTTTPTITISSPQAVNGNVCVGANVTFTASITGGGSAPSYQWKKNGNNVGGNSPTYNAGTGLVNGDIITCTLTSNAPCTTTNNVVSNAVAITIYPNTTASATITSSVPGSQVCAGIPVTFTVTSANGGATPAFQWRKDGNPIPGETNTTYIDPALTGGVITCQMTTSLPCATPAVATSNSINIIINAIGTASIDIYVSPDSAGCEGKGFIFSTYHINGGINPQYKWFLNGQHVPGAVLPSFQSKTLVDGDIVACEMASSIVCTFPVMSDGVEMDLIPSPVPNVDIYGVPNDQGITFYSNVTNAGTNPQYQWRSNNIDIPGATTATYTLFTYEPTDKINLNVESSDVCANPKSVLSNTLVVQKVTGVDKVSGIFGDLQLFPNPNEGRFDIKGNLLKRSAEEVAIEVVNALGQVVYKEVVQIINNGFKTQVNLEGRAAGMYTVRLQVDGQTQNMRFVLK